MDKANLVSRISVRVQPRAKATRLDGKIGDLYKMRLAAPPVDGKANDACTRLLAELLQLPLSSIRIVSGHGGRNKVIEVRGLDGTSVARRLDQ